MHPELEKTMGEFRKYALFELFEDFKAYFLSRRFSFFDTIQVYTRCFGTYFPLY